ARAGAPTSPGPARRYRVPRARSPRGSLTPLLAAARGSFPARSGHRPPRWGAVGERSRPRDDLDVGAHAVVIARADRALADPLALGQHDPALVDRAAAILLARGHEHVVDPAIEIERAQRAGEPVLARPRDALRRAVARSRLAMQPQPGVLEVRAPDAQRGEPAQEPDLVAVRGGVEVAAQDLRRAVVLAPEAADRLV